MSSGESTERKWRDRAWAAEVQFAALVAALRGLHVQPSPRVHNCAECDGLWPCATIKVLDAHA